MPGYGATVPGFQLHGRVDVSTRLSRRSVKNRSNTPFGPKSSANSVSGISLLLDENG